MNKKALIPILTVAAIILAAALLIPFPIRYKDGGSVEYRAALYSITDVHRISPENGFIDGLEIKILGFEVYSSLE